LIKSYLTTENASGATLRRQGDRESLTIGTSTVRDKENIAFRAGQLAQFSGTGPGNNLSYFISAAEPAGLQLAITYPSSTLDSIFATPPEEHETSGETFLADGEGYFVTKLKFPSTQGHTHPISARPMQSCLSGQGREVIDLDYRDISTVMGFRFIPEFGSACIMAHIGEEEAFTSLKLLERRLIISMLVFGLILVIVSVYVARNIVRPVTRLTKVARTIATGDYTAQAEVTGSDEISELAASFNFMTGQLYEHSAYLEDQVKERTKKLEQTQQETAALLRRNQALMKNSLDGITIMDVQGNIVEANDAFCSKLGYTQEEMAGLNAADWETQPVEELRERFKNLIGKSAVFETWHRCKDGTLINVEVSSTGIEIDGRQYVFSSGRDITGRKLAEERLQRSEHSLKEAQRIAHLGSWELDLVKDELTWSDEIYRIFEIDPEKFGVSYDAFLAVIHPDDRGLVNNAYTESVKNKTPYDIAHRLLMKDGRVKYVNEMGETYYGEDGKPLRSFGIVHDITERKRAEVQIAESLSLLQATNKALDEFTYIAAHDLKEPLRGIHNYTSFLKEDCGDRLDENARQYINSIQRLAERLSDLIDRLLAYSRLGSTELVRRPVDVDAVVDAVTEDLSRFWSDPSRGGMGVELRRNGTLGTVRGDATRIGEVFQNLIANAAKYNDKPSKWIEVGCDRSGASPVFYVRDNGIGIQAHHQESVFRIFKRLHEQNKYGGGTGAGLTITKKIIELHGGRIWLESTPGEGTTFYFTLSEDA